MFKCIKELFIKPKAEVIKPISSASLRAKLKSGLGEKLNKHAIIILADISYTPITVSKVKEIYNRTNLRNVKYVAELGDCDDFSILLKAELVKAVREDKSAKFAYAFGIVFGNIPTPHAINWFITPEEKIMFIEPQSGKIFPPKGKNIVFLFT